MASAELIAIGTELLLGEIQDTNTRFLTRQLRQIGVDVFRTSIVGDNPLRIADVITESLSRADIVITTGGLGPTIDDPTRVAAALAFNVEIEFHPDLWKVINHRFQSRGISPTENNKKQAFLPQGAIAIPNPVGTAPAFYLNKDNKILISLPGVPAEMEYIFTESVLPLLKESYHLLGVIKARVIHTTGMGESAIDNLISELEMLQNPTVGLSAHPGNVDIRITAKATSEGKADQMIAEVETVLRDKLTDSIYGVDDETLSDKIAQLVIDSHTKVELSIFGIDPSLTARMIPAGINDFCLSTVNEPFKQNDHLPLQPGTTLFLINLFSKKEISELELFCYYSDQINSSNRRYSGPPKQLDRWVLNNCMDFIWRNLRTLPPGE